MDREKEEAEGEGGLEEGTREMKEVERRWIGLELKKKEVEKQGKTGEVRRTAGRGGPPVAPPRKLQPPPTKAIFPELLIGFQMTILAIC